MLNAKQRIYECFDKGCITKFSNPGQRIIHVNVVHGGQIQCPHENCGSWLKTSSISYHLTFGHRRVLKNSLCRICRNQVTEYNFLRHFLQKCNLDSDSAEIENQSSNNKEDKIRVKKRCKNCKGKFCARNFALHLQRCMSNGEKKFICTHEGCNARFATSQNRYLHNKSVHEFKLCFNCGKQVKYLYFSIHLKRCTGSDEKKFSCSHEGCEKTFVTKIERDNHSKSMRHACIETAKKNSQ